MKYLSLFFFLFYFLGINAQSDPRHALLDSFLVSGMRDWHVPGLAAVVVKNGKVVFQKTYGVKNFNNKEAINAQTMFSMASTSKAITALALGVLVDDNKLDWDDKVQAHLPEFRLSDSCIASQLRIIDLLTHNIGIKNTDKLWVWDSLDAKKIMEKYSLAPMEYPFRAGFSYQNIPYILASEIISRASGSDYRRFIEKEIFEALGMKNSATSAKGVLSRGNYARPHIDDYQDGMTVIPDNFNEHIGGAGGFWSSIEDMGKYLCFLMNKGVAASGKTVLKTATFNFIFSPQVLIPNSSYTMFKEVDHNWHSYGLGWFQHDYQGEKLDYHTGSLAGMNAIAGIMHSKKTALFLFANSSDANLRYGFLYKVMDLYAFDELAGKDWNAVVRRLYGNPKARQEAAAEKRDEARVNGTSPKHPLEKYAGTYSHPMFGDVNISVENGKMLLNHNNYVFYSASHWHYETFITNKNTQWLYRILFKFKSDKNGNVVAIDYYDPYIEVEFVKISR